MALSTTMSGKRPALALLAILASFIMFFIERNSIFQLTVPATIAAFLTVALYLYLLFAEQRKIFLTSFYQIYYMVGLLISAAAISGGAQMIEVGAFGDANGSFWVILAFFLAGMEATCAGFRSRLMSSISETAKTLSWEFTKLSMIGLSGLVILLGAYVFLTVGSPVLLGVDRVTFWRIIAPANLSFFPSLAIQSYFFVGYFFLVSMKIKSEIFIPYAIFIFYIFITIFILGEKFSAFILIASALFMVLAGTYPDFKVRFIHLWAALLSLMFIVILIAFSYIQAGRDADFIFTRIALQAQLIWSVMADPQGFGIWPDPNWTCFFGCAWFDSGADFISYNYLPNNLYMFYYDVGTSLSGFLPALPIMTLGFGLAFSLHLIICFCLGVLQREVAATVSRQNFIAAFLLYKVLLGFILMWFGALFTAAIGTLVAAAALIGYLFLFGRGRGRGGRHQGAGSIATA